jgi:glycosyltransferase involved in cell wall biosynthesis
MHYSKQVDKINVFISMPVYNEAPRIENWLRSLDKAAGKMKPQIIIVNDKSSDDTERTIQEISNISITVLNNEVNLGHGPSTLRGMRYAYSLMDENSILITVDGDGHYDASTIFKMGQALQDSDAVVVEGYRINRNDPLYRKLTSFCTRLIILLFTRKFSKDANTPFHAYRKQILGDILSFEFVEDSLVPNLHISRYLRKRNIPTLTSNVLENSLEFGLPQGTTWKVKYRNLPSKKFIKFCLSAIQEVIKR